MCVILILAFFATSTRLLEPCIYGRIVDLLATGVAPDARSTTTISSLAPLCLAWFGATWIGTLLGSGASFLALRLGRDVSETAYLAGYDAATALPFEKHLRHDSSSTAKLLMDARAAAWDMTHLIVWRGATVTIGTAGTFLIAWWTSPAMTLVYATVMPLLAFFVTMQGRTLQHLQDASTDDADILHQHLADHLSNIIVFETNPCHALLRDLHAAKVSKTQASQHRVNRHWLLIDFAAPEAIGRTAVLLCGVWLVATGQMTLGVFAMFMGLVGELLTPLSLLADMCPIYARHASALSRLAHLLGQQPAKAPWPRATPGLLNHGSISTLAMRDVCYSYVEGDFRAGVRNVDMTFTAGRVYAIVGRSGSGKTTAARLLAGLLVPQSGDVQIDGTDIRHFDKKWLATHIAVVSQDGGVLNDTVWMNILCGRPDAAADDIRNAAQQAGVSEFVDAREQGIFSHMGQFGGVFSGGETQRVMIARALLKKADVVIMDEPTSALDPLSESRFLRVVESIREGRIIILIAHRASVIQSADHIYVLSGGEVVAQGSHRELMEQPGAYAELRVTS